MPRYPLPDALRGFSLLSMAGFHLTWDLIWLFGVRFPDGSDTLLYLWQQSICWSFISLSGFSLPFGRRPFRRGGELFCCGAAVAAVSFLLSSLGLTDGPLLFGILTFLGSAAILCAGLRPLLRRISPAAGFWASLLLSPSSAASIRACSDFRPSSRQLPSLKTGIETFSPLSSDSRRKIFIPSIISLCSHGYFSTHQDFSSTGCSENKAGCLSSPGRRRAFSPFSDGALSLSTCSISPSFSAYFSCIFPFPASK